MIDTSCSPASFELALAFAKDNLQAVRKTHNDTYVGEHCFVKCFGNRQRFHSELLGNRFMGQAHTCLPVNRVNILDVDYASFMIKYELAKAVDVFHPEVCGKTAFALHHQFGEFFDVGQLESWEDINWMRSRYLDLNCPDIKHRFVQLMGQYQEMKRTYGLEDVAIHSDLALHNTLEVGGFVVVSDWEWLMRGPREWDFVGVMFNRIRYKADSCVEKMIREYEKMGGVVRRDVLNVLYDIREINSLMYALDVGQRYENYQKQAMHRIDCLRDTSEEGRNKAWIIHV